MKENINLEEIRVVGDYWIESNWHYKLIDKDVMREAFTQMNGEHNIVQICQVKRIQILVRSFHLKELLKDSRQKDLKDYLTQIMERKGVNKYI